MSLDINWSLLSDPTVTSDAKGPIAGPSKPPAPASAPASVGQDESPHSQHPTAETLTNHLISVLNRQLASTSRPSFIGPIEITHFDFGSTAPEVEIKDIRDVWRAFDNDDEEDDDEYQDEAATYGQDQEVMYNAKGGGGSGYGYDSRRASGKSSELHHNGHYHYEPMLSPGDMGFRLPSMVDWDDSISVLSGSRRQSVHAVGLGARGLIGGGREYLTAPSLGGHLPGFGGSVFSHPLSPGPTSTRHPALTHTHISHPPSPARPPPKPSSTSSSSSVPSLQLHLSLSHTSDLTLTLLTSLIVNYPSSIFMSLPLKLSITGLQLATDLVVAFDGERKRVHITIIDDEADTTTSHGGLGHPVPVGQRLLPEMRIDSEIGHSDAHVLRNVGKVERFIADVVRKTLVDELVFPNFQTIAL